jgi:hypothetical protein
MISFNRFGVLDKPSSIKAQVHFITAHEIGLQVTYPSEIIESLTINYKSQNQSSMEELTISPALFNIRLTNLTCGNVYHIMMYASNQAGFSSIESFTLATVGAGKRRRICPLNDEPYQCSALLHWFT